ncbi:response regulator receiver modulated diguanylate cyclase [Promicromonospora sp. AC04]|uniref:diguanylate cyclase n=1 Tax=Promicromonospora sp. AC04 TaxID=2135723 RepID=UPI000D349009|nr:diguanylate cyclase [Promicromonospora sp. AC04]PUB25400.1 response regulator receiver modulated diguanylate cyclase [Promicromonospora sp. AC04]
MTTTTVLVADDSLVIRAVVRDGLESEGYRVVEAVDGVDAVRRCREDPPDVVLLDVEMPGLDGFQVLSELKGDAELRDIPVVFLTGRSTLDDVVAGLRGGAHDYLRKPFEDPELLARVAAAAHVKKLQDQLQQRNAELEQLSRTDSLTGLYNRRHLAEELDRLHSDSVRRQYPLCVVLFDLDHFKRVNDTYGHSAGDQVLRAFAGHLRGELRAGDIGGRWGGEEFLVILPDTGLDGALVVADRIRSATAASPVVVDGKSITVTVSGGCAAGPAGTADATVSLADVCMYRAKSSGRNRVAAAANPSTG